MKRSIKPVPKRHPKRDLFVELKEGMNALADARQGKRTLRTFRAQEGYPEEPSNRAGPCVKRPSYD